MVAEVLHSLITSIMVAEVLHSLKQGRSNFITRTFEFWIREDARILDQRGRSNFGSERTLEFWIREEDKTRSFVEVSSLV
jgi:hypothetical protein